MTKTATPDAVVGGQDITYTVSVTNNGPDPASGVTLTDPVPTNTTFQSIANPAGWSCSAPPQGGTGSIVCTNPSLAVGATATFTIVVRADSGLPPQTSITNTATVSASATADPVPTNDSASATTVVGSPPSADMNITNTVTPGSVAPDTTITYTITATNNGLTDASDVTISDPLPSTVTFVSVTPSAGGSATAPASGTTGTVTCVWAGPTAVHESRTITIVCRVSNNVADETPIDNTATVTNGVYDPDPSNNTATATATVAIDPGTPVADVSLMLTNPPSTVATGTFLEYRLVVGNRGPDTATNVMISGSTPVGTRFVSLTSSPAATAGSPDCTAPPVGGTGLFSCNLGDIDPGNSVVISFVVNVVAAGGAEITTSFSITSEVSDPNPDNNATAAPTTAIEAGNDTLLTWDPPLECQDDCLNPPLHLQTMDPPPGTTSKGVSYTGHLPSIVRDPRNTVIGYNIYRSNMPGVTPNPANFFTSVPPSVTSLVAPTAPGGSFFTVTAMYPNGESGGTNAASGGIPEPDITSIRVRGKKLIIEGTGFTDTVQVFVDGIPFTKNAKVKLKNGSLRIVQKGKLLTGQKVAQYQSQQGGVILVSVLNSDTGIGTFLYRGQ